MYWIFEVLICVIFKVLKIDFVDVECDGVNKVVLGCFGILLVVEWVGCC